MAARVCPDNVRAAHQSMHHLVADADWEDRAVLTEVARQVGPELLKKDKHCWWILDDTAHVKKGSHSVGVARQYCGRLGKMDKLSGGGEFVAGQSIRESAVGLPAVFAGRMDG